MTARGRGQKPAKNAECAANVNVPGVWRSSQPFGISAARFGVRPAAISSMATSLAQRIERINARSCVRRSRHSINAHVSARRSNES
jgi:hypothetical protein